MLWNKTAWAMEDKDRTHALGKAAAIAPEK